MGAAGEAEVFGHGVGNQVVHDLFVPVDVQGAFYGFGGIECVEVVEGEAVAVSGDVVVGRNRVFETTDFVDNG